MSQNAAQRPQGSEVQGHQPTEQETLGSPRPDPRGTGPHGLNPQSSEEQPPVPQYPEQGAYVADAARETLLPDGLEPQQATLLFVHAHPDDESTSTGATMAALADQGAAVHLLTLTRGEMGEVIGPHHAELDVRNPWRTDAGGALGRLRETELAQACHALGVRSHTFAVRGGAPGYFRDSGMSWDAQGRAAASPQAAADCLTRAGIQEAARAVAQSIRAVHPDVVVTYDADGGYGHPDHKRTHEAVLAALDLLTPEERPALVWGLEGEADPQDSRPQAVVHGDGKAKKTAMAAHRTQVRVGEGQTFHFSNEVVQPISSVETYRLLHGDHRLHGTTASDEPAEDSAGQHPDAEGMAPGPVSSFLLSAGLGLLVGFFGTMYHASIATFSHGFLPWGLVLALLLVFTSTLWATSHTQKQWAAPVLGGTAFLLVVLFAFLRPGAALVVPTPQAPIGWAGILWMLGILVMTWLSVVVAQRTVLRGLRR